MMIHRYDLVAKWLTEQGYSFIKHVKPYSLFANKKTKVGICVTCGLVVIGGVNTKDTEMTKLKWPNRDIESLKRIMDERVSKG